jgi:NAD+ synthase
MSQRLQDGGGSGPEISFDVLAIDCERAVAESGERIREIVFKRLRKKGAVVGMSGGIDSSVVAALCARALGGERVLGLLMPEGESSDESSRLGTAVAESQGVATLMENLTPVLEGAGCYRRRDDALREVIPGYGPGWRSKIVLPSVVDTDRYRIFSVIALSPDGREVKARLTPDAYLSVVAATNFKQRARKMMEYHHADRLNYAVAGTPNRLEYDQGFFVKNGDGAADFKPIAHLYKSQVYQLAEYLGVPEEVCKRPPTTDTYSLPQTQEEFYFSLPYDQMDLCLWARNHGVPSARVASFLGYEPEQIDRVYRDIDTKRRTTRYLHEPPLLLETVEEIEGV